MNVITDKYQTLHLNINAIESIYFTNEDHTSIVVRMVSGKEHFFDSSEAHFILAQYSFFCRLYYNDEGSVKCTNYQ